jgi:hypothetical protein
MTFMIEPPDSSWSRAIASRSTAGCEAGPRREARRPQAHALGGARQREVDDRLEAARERVVEVLAQVGGEDRDAVELSMRCSR